MNTRRSVPSAIDVYSAGQEIPCIYGTQLCYCIHAYPTELVQVQVRPVGPLSPWPGTSLGYRWDRYHPDVTDNHKYKECAVADSK